MTACVERLLGDWIDAFDITAQLFGRNVNHRLRHEALARARHARSARRRLCEARERIRMDCNRRKSGVIVRHRKPHDRGATGTSKSDPQDRRVAVEVMIAMHLLIVDPAFARPDVLDSLPTAGSW